MENILENFQLNMFDVISLDNGIKKFISLRHWDDYGYQMFVEVRDCGDLKFSVCADFGLAGITTNVDLSKYNGIESEYTKEIDSDLTIACIEACGNVFDLHRTVLSIKNKKIQTKKRFFDWFSGDET